MWVATNRETPVFVAAASHVAICSCPRRIGFARAADPMADQSRHTFLVVPPSPVRAGSTPALGFNLNRSAARV